MQHSSQTGRAQAAAKPQHSEGLKIYSGASINSTLASWMQDDAQLAQQSHREQHVGPSAGAALACVVLLHSIPCRIGLR